MVTGRVAAFAQCTCYTFGSLISRDHVPKQDEDEPMRPGRNRERTQLMMNDQAMRTTNALAHRKSCELTGHVGSPVNYVVAVHFLPHMLRQPHDEKCCSLSQTLLIPLRGAKINGEPRKVGAGGRAPPDRHRQ